MLDGDVQFITKFDLTLPLKGVVVTDDIDYTGLGETIGNFRGVITVSGPQGTIYENTDYDNPDITPGTSRESVIAIPLPLDPQTEYQVLKGNYTVRYTVRDITIPEDSTAVEVYSYTFDEPEIETTISSGPYSGILRSNDDTDYGDNITTLTREHRIQYPDEMAVVPADIVSSNENVEVTPIYTNNWTVIITSEVEYANPDTLQIKWGGTDTFTHCVYSGCINGMYDAVETLRDNFEAAILTNRVQAEAYERRLVLVNTSWHLLNIAYQDGDVEEADEQAAVIAEQIAYTGSGTCGGPTSELVIACPPFSGGGTPATYTFENGITEAAGTVRLGGTLTQATGIVLGSYVYTLSAADSGQTASHEVSAASGVLNKASDGTVEGRVYAEPDKVTIERAHLGTPANTRGYEITSVGLVEKADYSAGYTDRSLISKAYADSIGGGLAAVSSDGSLTGDGTPGDPLAVAAPFPGFDTLFNDYGYTEPTHAFSEITATPTTLAGYGITDAISTFINLTDTPAAYASHIGEFLRVNAGATALEFTTGAWVPAATGGTFAGQVTVNVANNYPLVSRKSGSGGTGGIPEAGINRLGFQDGDGDLQGYVGINASGGIELATFVAGQGISLLNDTAITGNLSVSGAFNPNSILFNTAYTPGSEPEGLVWWNDNELTINVSTGLGPVLQVGHEVYILIYNDTGVQIDNFQVLRPVSATLVSGYIVPTVELADATTFEGVEGTIMVATMDIPPGQIGLATRFGRARGGDASAWGPGDSLFVSTTPGDLTNVKPSFPSYDISVGGVLDNSDPGEIIISVTRDIFDTTLNFWNGTFRESLDFLITEAGGVITGSLSPTNGHDDMTMIFSDGLAMMDTDPAATVILTAGTDTIPQTNYVYVPQTTKVLTVSTSAWPTTEHIKVAQIYLQSATTTGTDGALRNQNWNDHIQSTTSNQGHLSHIGEKLRQFEAQWDSGAEGTMTIDTGPSPDDVWVSTTSGIIYQLHRQTFPAFDTETGDNLNVANHFTIPFQTITNINTQTSDALGNSLNNRSFSFVLWGVVNKSGEASHLMLNLPTGAYAYNSPSDAVSDADNYSVYDIPKAFQGVGFLIARYTMTYFNNAWTLFSTEDLRGKIPNVTAGGGGGGGGVSSFLALNDTPSSYVANGYKVPHVNVGETALEFIDGFYKTADFTGCASSSTTNINIGTTADLSFLLHYTSNRDVGTIQRRSGTIIVQYDSTTGLVTYGEGGGYVGDDLDFEIQADESAGNIRLNIIVGSVSGNSLNFDYKIYSKFAA